MLPSCGAAFHTAQWAARGASTSTATRAVPLRFREAAPVALRAVWALRGAAGWAAKTQKLGRSWPRRYGSLASSSAHRRVIELLKSRSFFGLGKTGFTANENGVIWPIISRYLCSRAAGYTFIEHCIECFKSCGPKTPSYTQPLATTTAVSLCPRAVAALQHSRYHKH